MGVQCYSTSCESMHDLRWSKQHKYNFLDSIPRLTFWTEEEVNRAFEDEAIVQADRPGWPKHVMLKEMLKEMSMSKTKPFLVLHHLSVFLPRRNDIFLTSASMMLV